MESIKLIGRGNIAKDLLQKQIEEKVGQIDEELAKSKEDFKAYKIRYYKFNERRAKDLNNKYASLMKLNPKASADDKFRYLFETLIELAKEASAVLSKCKLELGHKFHEDKLVWLNNEMENSKKAYEAGKVLYELNKAHEKATYLTESFYAGRIEELRDKLIKIELSLRETITFVFSDTAVFSGTTKTPDELEQKFEVSDTE